jgi:hypothetical protein
MMRFFRNVLRFFRNVLRFFRNVLRFFRNVLRFFRNADILTLKYTNSEIALQVLIFEVSEIMASL